MPRGRSEVGKLDEKQGMRRRWAKGEAVFPPQSIFHKPPAVAVTTIITFQARNPSIHLYWNRRHGDL